MAASKRLILLGAGASAEAGMPTGAGLHEQLLGNSALEWYRSVADRLMRATGLADVERIVRVLEYYSEADRDETLAHDVAVVERTFKRNAPAPVQARAEIEVIRDELRRHLWLSPPKFMLRLVDQGEFERMEKRVAYLSALVASMLGGTIATLNYDNTVEYAGGVMVKTTGPGRKWVTTPETADNSVRLLKLHGSLDWQRVGDDVLVGAEPWADRDYTAAIIFGAGNKLRHFGPYLDLFRAFVTSLRDATTVATIGYSYRDPHVTEALRLWARDDTGSEKRLYVCTGPGHRSLPHDVSTWNANFRHFSAELAAVPASSFISFHLRTIG